MRCTILARVVATTVMALLVFAPAWVQCSGWEGQPAEALSGSQEPLEGEWGTSAATVTAIPPFAFIGLTVLDDSLRESYAVSRYCSDVCFLSAPVTLPTGARITKLEMDAVDNDSSGEVECRLYRCPIQADTCVELAFVQTGFSATPGATLVSTTLNVSVANASNTYGAECFFSGGTSASRLRGLRVFTRLQVSPAPAVATFSDVPTGHWAFQYVEALVASGITAGCGGGNFCPDSSLTRGQLAVFLSKALGLHWPN